MISIRLKSYRSTVGGHGGRRLGRESILGPPQARRRLVLSPELDTAG